MEGLVAAEGMTPAEISEVLIKNRREKKKALSELVAALRTSAEERRKRMNEEEEEQEKRTLDEKDGWESDHHKCGERWLQCWR